MSDVSTVGWVALTTALVVGVLAHELAHGVVLRWYGYEHEYGAHLGQGNILSRLAGSGLHVRWDPLAERARGIEMMLAAMAPIAILVPALAVWKFAGLSSMPTRLALIAIIGTSIPSPKDFQTVWVGFRWWDDYVECALDAVANHEVAEGLDPVV